MSSLSYKLAQGSIYILDDLAGKFYFFRKLFAEKIATPNNFLHLNVFFCNQHAF